MIQGTSGRQASLLAIGQYPPPFAGTSVPFKSLVDYLRANTHLNVKVCNTHGPGGPLVSRGPVSAVSALLRMCKEVATDRSSAVFISGSNLFICTAGSLLTALAWFRSVPAFVYIHGGSFEEYYAQRPMPWRWFVQASLRRAKFVFLQTQYLQHQLQLILPNSASVPNWTVIEPSTNKSFVTRDEIKLLFIGEVRPDKGVNELLDAFAEVKQRLGNTGRHMTLDVYGPLRSHDLGTRPELENAVPDVTYHGQTAHDEIVEALRNSDVLILPTYQRTEGYPGVILEAMAAGLCIVTTEWRAIPELIQHEDNGILCRPRDVTALADAIERIVVDTELRKRLSYAALESSVAYTAASVLRRLCDLCGFPMRPDAA